MQKVLLLITVSLVIQHLVNQFKPFFTWKHYPLIASAVAGLVVAWAIQVDFLTLIGFENHYPFVGWVITGLGFAGGSNTIFDLVKKRDPKVEVVEVAEMTDGIGHEE